MARKFPKIKEINNITKAQFKQNSEVVKSELGDLRMFDDHQNIQNTREMFSQILNFITLNQSEKFYIQKRINSKILIGKLSKNLMKFRLSVHNKVREVQRGMLGI